MKLNKSATKWLTLATYLGLAAVLAFWVAIVARIVLVKGNHIGMSLNPMLYVFIAVLLLAIACFVFSRKLVAVVTALCCAASIYGMSYIDKHNLLIQYEVWLKRGMPGKGMPANR
jgi:hypothetical protein